MPQPCIWGHMNGTFTPYKQCTGQKLRSQESPWPTYSPLAAGSRVGSQRGGQQPAETVQICCRIEAKLDPVSPGWITPDGGIGTEAVLDLRPSGARDP